MLLTFISGLIAGSAHVVTGPDHLAALAPIAAHSPHHGTRLGLRWGLGHGMGVLCLGIVGILARDVVDIGVASAWAEFLVGVVLMAVGIWAFHRSTKMVIHSHVHDHGVGHDHVHFHVHESARNHEQPEAHQRHSHAAFLVGMLHGAAGTGHLFGVLPSLALPMTEAALYLGAYFVSAVGAMALFGCLMGRLGRGGGLPMMRKLMYTTSTLAIGLGVLWVVQGWPI